jgi:hypothetical protein
MKTKMKVGYLEVGLGLASVILMGVVSTPEPDEWFLLSEQTIKSTMKA